MLDFYFVSKFLPVALLLYLWEGPSVFLTLSAPRLVDRRPQPDNLPNFSCLFYTSGPSPATQGRPAFKSGPGKMTFRPEDHEISLKNCLTGCESPEIFSIFGLHY